MRHFFTPLRPIIWFWDGLPCSRRIMKCKIAHYMLCKFICICTALKKSRSLNLAKVTRRRTKKWLWLEVHVQICSTMSTEITSKWSKQDSLLFVLLWIHSSGNRTSEHMDSSVCHKGGRDTRGLMMVAVVCCTDCKSPLRNIYDSGLTEQQLFFTYTLSPFKREDLINKKDFVCTV